MPAHVPIRRLGPSRADCATTDAAYATTRTFVRDLGAEAVAVTPAEHDALVALVSHVPQLAASTLMDVASTQEARHRALLRLAAGGFRDMTRIAASHPEIWLDILAANRDAVLAGLDAYVEALGAARQWIAAGDADALAGLLARARSARRNLPVGAEAAVELAELRVPIPDRTGVLAEVTTLAGRLGVNIADVEIAHSIEGSAGVLVLVVPAADAGALAAELREHGYAPGRAELA
ncbi:MAG: prephenate dehydrogenase dimerization domain-containing protein [Actinomycetota bacterium]